MAARAASPRAQHDSSSMTARRVCCKTTRDTTELRNGHKYEVSLKPLHCTDQ